MYRLIISSPAFYCEDDIITEAKEFDDTILEFIKCEYSNIKLNSFLVLYDQKNQIRGYYISDNPKEYERLDVEIDILKSNYEK